MDSLDREIAEAFTEHPPAPGPGRILIVGGAADFQRTLEAKLVGHGHECESTDRLDGALQAVGRTRFDLVLLHTALPDGNGLELARTLGQTSPSTRTIVRPVHLSMKGFSDDPTAFDEVLGLVEGNLKRALEDDEVDPHRLAQVIRRTVGKWVSDTHRRRPMIIPTVLEV